MLPVISVHCAGFLLLPLQTWPSFPSFICEWRKRKRIVFPLVCVSGSALPFPFLFPNLASFSFLVLSQWWFLGEALGIKISYYACKGLQKSLIHLNFYCNTLSQCIPWAEAQDRTKSNSLENVNLLTGLYNITPLETGSKEMSYFAHNLNLSILDFTSDKQGIKYILGTRARFNLLQA